MIFESQKSSIKRNSVGAASKKWNEHVLAQPDLKLLRSKNSYRCCIHFIPTGFLTALKIKIEHIWDRAYQFCKELPLLEINCKKNVNSARSEINIAIIFKHGLNSIGVACKK
jgi:hypothetical protein